MKRVAKLLNRNTGVMLIATAILGLTLSTTSGNVFAQQNMTNMTSSTTLTTDGRTGAGGMMMQHGSSGEGMSGMGGMTGGGGQHGAGGMMMQHGSGGGEGMSGMGGMTGGGGQHGAGGMMMQHGSDGSSGGGEGMSGMGGMTGGGGQHGAGGMMMGGSGMEQKPGMMSEMCSMSEGMPPHYCEPSYHVMSSAKGIRINDVFPVNDKQLGLEIQNINRNANATNQDIVIVGGGGGSLAGASVIQGGWSNSTEGYLNLDGNGSIYDINSVHIHVFPITE